MVFATALENTQGCLRLRDLSRPGLRINFCSMMSTGVKDLVEVLKHVEFKVKPCLLPSSGLAASIGSEF